MIFDRDNRIKLPQPSPPSSSPDLSRKYKKDETIYTNINRWRFVEIEIKRAKGLQNYNFIDTRPLCQPLCKIDLSRLDGDRNQCNSLKLNKTTGEIQSSGLSLFHKQGTLAISKREEKNEYYRRSIRPFAFQTFSNYAIASLQRFR